ncbi:3alpha(or 20beta)-hydroxysteroid dehydrogenase [Lentzea atacamensis]|uniref:3alpha(Or 20beta)-hydroxysteroid dehydrogenase n=1 Tax=Lentzea atacamensis TaxID=531938 RepID=A0A316I3A0_9PSEU|nr:glucose 1-dehydrogenase [Lentzea atacamensis]PWK87124.1 3alpha(or 20beta)-hydroxysteroid dehydrogenase [Lentzea atacamensis]RAS70168.1 3alpha(or 20beta)-hydroxysteroid dehydrogenase [Lentzea atacamensis]
MRLDGKIALITGAARGQGAAAARRFAEEGARVMLTDVLDDQGKELAAELGAEYCHLDVSNEDEWAEAVAFTISTFGDISVLVNNAGVLHFSALTDTTLADYQRVIGINQVGTFLGMRAVVESMTRAGGGSIVNVSSVEGLGGMPYLVAYTASKFAIRGMTKVAAMELGQHGIRVNSVHPGAINTPMVGEALGRPVDISPIGKKVALRRVGQPEDVANVVLFLASSESAYCTGAEFVVDGGATATHALS